MFSAANTLSLVLQSDCKDFGSIQLPVAKTLHTLEDMSNDVRNIHVQCLRNFCAKSTQKGEVTWLNNEKKIPQKGGAAIFKTVTR